MSWCTIESDPGVFTSLIEAIGVTGVQVEELYALEPAGFAPLEPIHGLVFCFKWDAAVARPSPASPATTDCVVPHELFFAHQVIPNACATQALLAIVLNIETSDVDLGPTLNDFRTFTREFPPELKGLAISNSDAIRLAHNSFTPPDPFVMDKPDDTHEADGDAFHFVAYVPFRGHVYELDGLQQAPVCVGAITDASWLSVVRPIIQQRIARYSSSEIRFNLLALIQNRRQLYENQLKVTEDLTQRQVLEDKIQFEDEKKARWEIENVRRKHNYLPLIIQLLKILAQKQKLLSLVEKQLQKTSNKPQ